MTPKGVRFGDSTDDKNAIDNQGAFVVKPVDDGDSNGLFFASSFSETIKYLERKKINDKYQWLIEEYIAGDPGTIALIKIGDHFLTSEPLRIKLPQGSKLYDYELKFNGHDDLHYDKFRNDKLISAITLPAERMYRLFDCRGFVRFDFVFRRSKAYFIEMNTFPGLYPHSNLAKAFHGVLDFTSLVLLNLSSAL